MEYVLVCLSQEDKDASNRLTDTYELWISVAKQYSDKELSADIREIVRDGLMTIWNLTLKTAMFQ